MRRVLGHIEGTFIFLQRELEKCSSSKLCFEVETENNK